MENLPQQESSAPFAGGIAAALVILLGLFAVTQEPLKSARPVSTPSNIDIPLTDEKVPARLWQDPFEVVQAHASQSPDNAEPVIEELVDFIKVSAEQGKPAGETLQGNETAGQQNQLVNETPGQESIPGEQPLRDAFKKHCKEMDSIIVMASMVFGGSYNEIREGRIRARYATLTALANQSFVPVDSKHIGYFRTQLEVPEPKSATATQLLVPYEWLEPVPSSDRDVVDERSAILLLWLNDDLFNMLPLHSLNELLREVTQFAAPCNSSNESGCTDELQASNECRKYKISKRIIGPAGSTTLKAMVEDALSHLRLSKEDQMEQLKHLKGVRIYSPSATASGRDWMAFLRKGDIVDFKRERELGCSHDQPQVGPAGDPACKLTKPPGQGVKEQHRNIDYLLQTAVGSRFISTILPDRVLMNELVAELDLRTRNLGSASVALVSEWDTHYARELPESFVEALREKLDENAKDAEGRAKEPEGYEQHWEDYEQGPETEKQHADKDRLSLPSENIYRYSYMRGIDGHLPDSTESNSGESNNGGSEVGKDSEFAPREAKRRRPAGHSQYDYLLRMAGRMEGEGAKLKRKELFAPPGGFLAIGVLGSDVYDKLLIMQALNARFPSAIFFTTDIDAGFSHPVELPHTRNLLVASSFGLELNKQYYGVNVGRPPPFRDVYQTSRYLATYLSVDKEKELSFVELTSELQPRLFEMGRTGPIDISQEVNDPSSLCDTQKEHPCADIHPVSDERHTSIAKPVLLTVLILSFLLRSGQDSCKKFRFVQNLTRFSPYSRVNRFPERFEVSIV